MGANTPYTRNASGGRPRSDTSESGRQSAGEGTAGHGDEDLSLRQVCIDHIVPSSGLPGANELSYCRFVRPTYAITPEHVTK